VLILIAGFGVGAGSTLSASDDDGFRIGEAEWKDSDHRLVVKGTGRDGLNVVVSNAADGATIGSDRVDDHEWRIRREGITAVPCRVRAEQSDGQVSERNVSNAPADCDVDGGGGPVVSGDVTVVAANDLGMHCADLDYRVFSILPPFNVVHAQVIRKGTLVSSPLILDDTQVELTYQATANPHDPAGANSINTTSQNLPGIFKSNFWSDSGLSLTAGLGAGNFTVGGLAYQPLYPGVQVLADLGGPDLSSLCDDPPHLAGCPSALALFEPLPADTGIPVPDPTVLFPASPGDPPLLVTGQQQMPGLGNTPQHFDRFDVDLPFFVNFGFGFRGHDLKWFAADGIPILPVDDSGRPNAYPLMKVTARDRASRSELASLDVVLPVASEADCQSCHVEALDCLDSDLPQPIQTDSCDGSAVSHTSFAVASIDDAPGDSREQQLLNAAKINILRLHDVKHGADYQNWDASKSLAAMVCDPVADPADPDCLTNQTPVQCSRCHYSPALDLAQAGPVDEPEQGLNGRQQVHHISMSRAMHGHHGNLPPFAGRTLFPPMPEPLDRDPMVAQQVLEETCYQCHPGKRTQCLRGAMAAGGVVCQDCHGDMAQVGNDFTVRVSKNNPGDFVLDGSLRVPWAFEPGCQSCHTGDAVNLNHPSDPIVSDDGIRLLQAYATDTLNVPGVAGPLKVADMIRSPASRFAENQAQNADGDTVDVLYRLSKGHGGVMCEGCHNSTHAIWPIQNPFANDNVASTQLQGHSGTLIECDACHAARSLGLTLGGPHGMHPVNDPNWTHNHEDFLDDHSKDTCRACHGRNGEGTVLARMAATRNLECKDEDLPRCDTSGRITLQKFEQVSCSVCHENEI